VTSGTSAAPRWSAGDLKVRARAVLLGALIVVLAAVTGVVLAAVGGRAGPAVMFALPVGAGLLVVAVLHPRVALALFVLALPVGGIAVPGGPGDMKVVHLAAAVAVMATVLNRLGTSGSAFSWVRPMAWVLGIFAFAIAATPGALDVPTAVKQDVTLTISVAFAFTIPTVCRNLRELRPLVLLLLAVGAVMCATSFGSASQLQATYNGALVNNRAVGVFHQPNELGTFSGMLLMLAIGVWFGARSYAERLLAFASAVIAVTALALTLSRGAWIGVMLAALLVIWLLPTARRATVILGIPLVILAAGLGSFRTPPPQLQILTERVQSISTPAANPYDDRPAIYREAIHVIETHPLLGVGPENFIVAATKAASDTQTVAPLHAHNFLMTVAAELGLPAAALLVGLTLSIGWRVRHAARLREPGARALTVGFGAALVVLLGQGVVDFTLRNPVIFTFVWSVLGMTLVAVREVDHASDAPVAPLRGEHAALARP
jgi:putative inorganic carbon (hco3(-)) transporter